MHRFLKRTLKKSSSYVWYASCRTRTRYATELTVQVDRLADVLETDRCELAKDIKRLGLMESATAEEMLLNVSELQKQGFSNRIIVDYIHLICVQPLFLKNRLQICQEVGCPQSKVPAIVLNFNKFLHAHTPILRAYGVIVDPTFKGFIDRLLNHLDLEEGQLFEKLQRTHSILEIYKILCKSYLFLQVPALKDIPDISESKDQKERITSLLNFRKNVKFLADVLKFNTEEMVKYKSLLYNDCANMIHLLQSSHGIRIKDMIPENPELMDVIKDRYDAVYKVIKETKLNFSTFMKHSGHFNMSFKEFEYHFNNSTTSPYLSVFKYHHRLPQLVEHGRIANERLHILHHMNMKCYNMNVLIGDSTKFLKYVSDGVDKVNPDDTYIMLSNELNQPFEDIKKSLKKNDFIEFISIHAIKSNLEYLRELGFEDEDIYRNIQLLLYPKDIIHDNIMKIHMGEFTISKGPEKLTIERKHFLSLSLYRIEKEHGFASSFMWSSTEKMENVGQETMTLLG